MNFSKEQRRTAYKKLSLEVQNFIMDSETTELITNYLKEASLSEEQVDTADSEILYAMYGLQSLSDAILNIAKISGKNVNDLSKLKNDLDTQIFSKIPKSAGGSVKIDDSRMGNIAQKYSLNQEQVEKLSELAGENDIEKMKSESFKQKLVGTLGISPILAEQIVQELGKVTDKPQKSPQQLQPARVPETKPNNLPSIEIGEVVHTNKPEFKPFVSATKPIEPIQKPYGMPRFGMAQVPPKVQVINMNQNKPANPQNMMDNKMNSVTVNMGENFSQKDASTPAENNPPKLPSTKYNADPYREPLN